MSVFRPDITVFRIWELNPRQLKQEGIHAIFMDLDNTLAVWNGMMIEDRTLRFLSEAREAGFFLCIVSNNHAERILPVAEKLNLPFLEAANKPLPFRLKKQMLSQGLHPQECMLVGDQVMTDLPAGNLIGMRTVLTVPIDTRKEFWWTYINRILEHFLLRCMGIHLPTKPKTP